MANMDKLSTFECITEVTNFSVGCCESSKPVICYTNGWNYLSFATVFKAGLVENCNLFDCKVWRDIGVWCWEDVSIV